MSTQYDYDQAETRTSQMLQKVITENISAPEGIAVNATNVIVQFAEALSGADKAELDSIMADMDWVACTICDGNIDISEDNPDPVYMQVCITGAIEDTDYQTGWKHNNH